MKRTITMNITKLEAALEAVRAASKACADAGLSIAVDDFDRHTADSFTAIEQVVGAAIDAAKPVDIGGRITVRCIGGNGLAIEQIVSVGETIRTRGTFSTEHEYDRKSGTDVTWVGIEGRRASIHPDDLARIHRDFPRE